MEDKTVIGMLLIALFIVIGASGIIIYMGGEEKSTQNLNKKDSSQVINTSSEKVQLQSQIISSDFWGEYEKSDQNVVVDSSGEYYIVEDGFVLVDNLRIDATNENSLDVYELKRAR